MPSDKNTFSLQNKVTLIRGGAGYFNVLLELINNATESIHIQTYIYDEDETGRQVAEALRQAVQRKVEVHLMADGYASKKISGEFVAELKAAGIRFRFLNRCFAAGIFILAAGCIIRSLL